MGWVGLGCDVLGARRAQGCGASDGRRITFPDGAAARHKAALTMDTRTHTLLHNRVRTRTPAPDFQC